MTIERFMFLQHRGAHGICAGWRYRQNIVARYAKLHLYDAFAIQESRHVDAVVSEIARAGWRMKSV